MANDTPIIGNPLIANSGATTAQLSVDQQRNQLLSSISLSLLNLAAGSTVFAFNTIAGSTTLTTAQGSVAIDATGGAATVTLPLAASVPGKKFIVKKIDSSGNAVTLTRAGSDLIDGATTKALSAQWNFTVIQSFGAGLWYIVG